MMKCCDVPLDSARHWNGRGADFRHGLSLFQQVSRRCVPPGATGQSQFVTQFEQPLHLLRVKHFIGLRFEIIRNGCVAEAQLRGICVAMDAMQAIECGVLDYGADGAAGYFRQSALDLFGFRSQLAIADNIKGSSIGLQN